MEQRANNKLCLKLGKWALETYQMLKQVYGDDTLACSSVEWFNRFRNGRENLDDSEHTGRPRTNHAKEQIEKVREIFKYDRFVSMWLIEELTGIRKSTVYRISTGRFEEEKGLCVVHPTFIDWWSKKKEWNIRGTWFQREISIKISWKLLLREMKRDVFIVNISIIV